MANNPPELSLSSKIFKQELKLDPKELTLEYMKQQDKKLGKPEVVKEIEKSIRKAEFPVLILGDNEKPGEPSKILEGFQKDIVIMGFRCALGSHIYAINEGKFEDDIERKMLEDTKYPKLIIMISGKGFATIGEAKIVRSREDLKDKTLFFFDHEGDFEKLVNLAKEKRFPIEFKYPIPYCGEKELKGKVLFGVLHCFYRYLRYKRDKEKPIETNNK